METLVTLNKNTQTQDGVGTGSPGSVRRNDPRPVSGVDTVEVSVPPHSRPVSTVISDLESVTESRRFKLNSTRPV